MSVCGRNGGLERLGVGYRWTSSPTAISDLPAMYEPYAIIGEEARERRLIVIAGHDPDVLTRFRVCVELPSRALPGSLDHYDSWQAEAISPQARPVNG